MLLATFMYYCMHVSLHISAWSALSQKEEEDARKLYDEFVESFGDEPEQKATNRSFTRGGVIQPGSSASSAGKFSLQLAPISVSLSYKAPGTAMCTPRSCGVLKNSSYTLFLQGSVRKRPASMFHLSCRQTWRLP